MIGRDRVDNSGNIGTDNRIGSDGPIRRWRRLQRIELQPVEPATPEG